MKRSPQPAHWLTGARKWITVSVTTAAAVIGLLANARNLGLTSWLGAGSLSYADIAARRVLLHPTADTLHAIGDTLQLAATVTDERGATIAGATIIWRTEDSSVVTVDSSGTALARGPGTATVTAAVREHVGRSRVTVWQRATSVMVGNDSVLKLAEGSTMQLAARAVDRRGHGVAGTPVTWESADTGIVVVDRSGNALARAPGRTSLTASALGLTARIQAEVVLTAATIRLVSGADQRGAAGRRLPQPVAVQVFSRTGRPVPDAVVTFSPENGEGTVDPPTAAADRTGRARSTWGLGPAAGRQRLFISVGGTDSTVVVTADADPVLRNTLVQLPGEKPTGRAGQPLPAPVGIRVTDSAGVAFANVPVAWAALDGGSITALAERTDSLGEARAKWTLGPRAGTQRARVQVGNPRLLPPRTVTAIALPSTAAGVLIVGGDAQEGPVGATLRRRVLARVTDHDGNPVPGATVTVTPRGGSVPDTALTADSSGTVAVRWTLGRAAGTQHLDFKVAEVPTVARASARARPREAANVSVSALPTTGVAGRLLPRPIAIAVTDAYGNAIPDAPTVIAVSAGTVSPTRVMTDQHGQATTRWILGSKPGEQTINVSVRGTTVKTTFTVRATTGATRAR